MRHHFLPLLLFLISCRAVTAGECPSRFTAPDGNAEAFVLCVPAKDFPEGESCVAIRDSKAKTVCMKDLTSGDGEHGLAVVSGLWTPDSQYFVFSTTSSGGHSPWHFRTFVYDRAKSAVVQLWDYVKPVVSPDITASAPNTIRVKVFDDTRPEPIDGRWIDVALREVLAKGKP